VAQKTGVVDTGIVEGGEVSKAMADSNQTLTTAEAENGIVIATGAMTAGRNLTVPHNPGRLYVVYNNTTGGFAVTVVGPTGTGIAIAATKHAIVRSDGTNYVRVTADV
jgi:hypothetical protein